MDELKIVGSFKGKFKILNYIISKAEHLFSVEIENSTSWILQKVNVKLYSWNET